MKALRVHRQTTKEFAISTDEDRLKELRIFSIEKCTFKSIFSDGKIVLRCSPLPLRTEQKAVNVNRSKRKAVDERQSHRVQPVNAATGRIFGFPVVFLAFSGYCHRFLCLGFDISRPEWMHLQRSCPAQRSCSLLCQRHESSLFRASCLHFQCF